MRYFVDTSALVKYYIQETGTVWIRQLFEESLPGEIFIASITGVELLAAIGRRSRAKEISKKEYQYLVSRFEEDFESRYTVIEVNRGVISKAMELTRQHPLRGYDAVQLAAALSLKSELGTDIELSFICADELLYEIAEIYEFRVDDPNNHP